MTNILTVKVWLKSDENWKMSRVLKIIKLGIWQSAPNDPKPNSNNRTSKVGLLHICAR